MEAIQWKQYLSIFGDFSGGLRCVSVQLLLIQTHFSVQFYIRRTAILSYPLSGDMIILCVRQIYLEL